MTKRTAACATSTSPSPAKSLSDWTRSHAPPETKACWRGVCEGVVSHGDGLVHQAGDRDAAPLRSDRQGTTSVFRVTRHFIFPLNFNGQSTSESWKGICFGCRYHYFTHKCLLMSCPHDFPEFINAMLWFIYDGRCAGGFPSLRICVRRQMMS